MEYELWCGIADSPSGKIFQGKIFKEFFMVGINIPGKPECFFRLSLWKVKMLSIVATALRMLLTEYAVFDAVVLV